MSVSPPRSGRAALKPTRVRLGIFFVLWLIVLLNYIDRSALSIALPYMSEDLDLDPGTLAEFGGALGERGREQVVRRRVDQVASGGDGLADRGRALERGLGGVVLGAVDQEVDLGHRVVALVRLVLGERVGAHHGALHCGRQVDRGQRRRGVRQTGQRACGRAGCAAHGLGRDAPVLVRLAEPDRHQHLGAQPLTGGQLDDLVGLAGRAERAENLLDVPGERGGDLLGACGEFGSVCSLDGADDQRVDGQFGRRGVGQGELRCCHVRILRYRSARRRCGAATHRIGHAVEHSRTPHR